MTMLKKLVLPVFASALAVSASYVLAVDQVSTQGNQQNKNERMDQRGMNQGQGQGRGMNQSQGQGQNRGMNQGQGRGMQQGQNAMPSFADFDLNNDGKISEEELTEARTARISQRAMDGRQMRGLVDAASFADFDTNNDGSISPEEFSKFMSVHSLKKGQ